MISIFSPKNWKEYSLIDCGDFEKLERFGQFVLRRPEPQAIWKKALPEKDWNKLTDITFKSTSSHKGEWLTPKNFKEPWFVEYLLFDKKIKFKLRLTAFKHVGIFPEQADNWEFIYQRIKHIKKEVNQPKVLNLFAYTGGASLAAKAAGADVVHVDSVKQVVSWANENQQISNLENIRWVVEDAMKFAEREANRGNLYHGIILDPPAYGIGAKGERWKLEEMIDPLLQTLSKILHPQHRFLVLNAYSLSFSSLIINNLIKSNFHNVHKIDIGELVLNAESGNVLPLGVIGRII
ncbi:MAG: class I SAM-dependent methyltransferase [Flavobacteriales bacterium]|nr:class I SAM-dependent methyltransferase [Flavobacteriales bacterium]